jgi:RecJ-like exonuclease
MIDITIDDETFSLPSKKEVCYDCDGNTYVLTSSIRDHAYSMEEFVEEFDEEGRSQYFRVGGAYDVLCPTCKGKNVIDVIDEAALNLEQKEIFELWQIYEEEIDQLESVEIYERRMGA